MAFLFSDLGGTVFDDSRLSEALAVSKGVRLYAFPYNIVLQAFYSF